MAASAFLASKRATSTNRLRIASMAAVLLVIRVEAPKYALATAPSSADLTSG